MQFPATQMSVYNYIRRLILIRREFELDLHRKKGAVSVFLQASLNATICLEQP